MQFDQSSVFRDCYHPHKNTGERRASDSTGWSALYYTSTTRVLYLYGGTTPAGRNPFQYQTLGSEPFRCPLGNNTIQVCLRSNKQKNSVSSLFILQIFFKNSRKNSENHLKLLDIFPQFLGTETWGEVLAILWKFLAQLTAQKARLFKGRQVNTEIFSDCKTINNLTAH